MKNKFYLGKLHERNGEYEYIHNVPFETDGISDPDKWLRGYAREFYGQEKGEFDRRLDGWYFDCGGIFVRVESIQEIVLSEYAVLKKLSI